VFARPYGTEKSKVMESGLFEQETEERHCAADALRLNFDVKITSRE
jgi:hypothetical protein